MKKKITVLFAAVITFVAAIPVFAQTTVMAEAVSETDTFGSVEAAEAAEAVETPETEQSVMAGNEPTAEQPVFAGLLGKAKEYDFYWYLTDGAAAGETTFYLTTKKSSVPTGAVAGGGFDSLDRFYFESQVPWKDYKDSVTKAVIGGDGDTIYAKYAAYWFSGCQNLKEVDLDGLRTPGAGNSLQKMFYHCSSLQTIDLSKLEAASDTDASYMFAGCSSLTTIYADSQNRDLYFSPVGEETEGLFDGCVSLVAEGGKFFEKMTYADLLDPDTGEPDHGGMYAAVNGYYGRRGIFTECSGAFDSDGIHVRFNHKWLDLPVGAVSASFDMREYGADSGQITLKRNAAGLVNEIVIDSVKLSEYTPIAAEGSPAILFIDARVLGAYRVTFLGETDLMYREEPTREKDPENDSLLAVFPAGSTAEIRGEGGAVLKVSGLNVQEYRNGRREASEIRFADLAIRSHTLDHYAMMTYATGIFFDRCDIETKTIDDPICFILGIGNTDLPDDQYRVEFRDTVLDSENLFQDTFHAGLGYPSPSAFNVSHTDVVLKDCDVHLHLPHVSIGECRGVYMLHGGITIDGGAFSAVVGDDPVDTDSLEVSCGIQAVYVNIRNNAKVDLQAMLDPEKYHDPEHSISTWGIIYARNVVVEDSELSILAEGRNSQGIYYFGKSTVPAGVTDFEGALPEDEDHRAYHLYGDVIFRNSDVSIRLDGSVKNYVSAGISARHLYFDYPKGSSKTVDIAVKEESGCCLTVAVYDFQKDGNVDFMNAAKLTFPKKAELVNTQYPAYYAGTTFYTFADPEKSQEDLKEAALHHIIVGAAADPYTPSYSGTSAKPFTGTWDAPVTGTWTRNQDGTWSFATTARFVSTWGYIVNPYDGGNAAWFRFDANGKMLTGWQWIKGADGVGRCYYLNPVSDGTLGACQIGGTTPDGYTLDENGAWTVNGIIQEQK